MKIKRKLLKNSLLDVKTYFFVKSLKNIEEMVIYAVLGTEIQNSNVRVKTEKQVACAILEKKNIVANNNVFFGFLPPTKKIR